MAKDKDFRIFTFLGLTDKLITIALAQAALCRDRPQDNRDGAAKLLGISRRSLDREIARRRSEDY